MCRCFLLDTEPHADAVFIQSVRQARFASRRGYRGIRMCHPRLAPFQRPRRLRMAIVIRLGARADSLFTAETLSLPPGRFRCHGAQQRCEGGGQHQAADGDPRMKPAAGHDILINFADDRDCQSVFTEAAPRPTAEKHSNPHDGCHRAAAPDHEALRRMPCSTRPDATRGDGGNAGHPVAFGR